MQYYYDINKVSVDKLNTWVNKSIIDHETRLKNNIILVSIVKNNITYTISLTDAYEGSFVLSLNENSDVIISAIINRENGCEEFKDSFVKQYVILKKLDNGEINMPLYKSREEVNVHEAVKTKVKLVEPKGKSCSKCGHYEDTLKCKKRNCRLGELGEAAWCKHYWIS